MRVLGVDPGAGGALAVIENGQLMDLHDMPVGIQKIGKSNKRRIIPAGLAQLLRDLMPLDAAYVEEVGVRRGEAPTASFAFGQGRGFIVGALAALWVPTFDVRPQDWRKLVGVRGRPGDKGPSRMTASQRWPSWAGSFARVKDDGRAEAALIAFAGYLKESNHGPED